MRSCALSGRIASKSACLTCRRKRCSAEGGSFINPVIAEVAECLRACIDCGGGVKRSPPPGCIKPRSPNVVGVESRRRWCWLGEARVEGSWTYQFYQRTRLRVRKRQARTIFGDGFYCLLMAIISHALFPRKNAANCPKRPTTS